MAPAAAPRRACESPRPATTHSETRPVDAHTWTEEPLQSGQLSRRPDDGPDGRCCRAAASPRLASLVDGIALADSWATDAHKWLNVPYDCGVALVRDPASLQGAMGIRAAYLPDEDRREPSRFGPELSRRARGVEVWAALKHLGRDGLAAMIERCCAHARRFATGLSEAGHTVLNEVVLNQVLVSFGDAGRTQRIIAAVQAEGTCWCSGTVWQGQSAMRISVSSWATTADDVERSLEVILRIAAVTP
ncbi:MAG: pyridoxal phosphate-dependent decarboxylase family protein [Gammaproteobacteria bacterium]